jgi:hypothetical protein
MGGDWVDEAGLEVVVVYEEKEGLGGMEMPSDGFPRLWPVCMCMSAESDRAGGLP